MKSPIEIKQRQSHSPSAAPFKRLSAADGRLLFSVVVVVALLLGAQGAGAAKLPPSAAAPAQTTFPPGGTDRFDVSSVVDIEFPIGQSHRVFLHGPMSIVRGNSLPPPEPQMASLEITELNLGGVLVLPQGPVPLKVTLNTGERSTGEAKAILDPGAQRPLIQVAFSLFVNVEVETPDGEVARNVEPLRFLSLYEPETGVIFRCQVTLATLKELPPAPLAQRDGTIVGFVKGVQIHICQAVAFSVSRASLPRFEPADILIPLEFRPAQILYQEAQIGLRSGDDIDALSSGLDFVLPGQPMLPRFSVGFGSRGVTGSSVRAEATACGPPGAQADEFGLKPTSPSDSPCVGSNGPNFLCYDEDGAGGGGCPRAFRLGLENNDDIDAIDEIIPLRPEGNIYFSLAPGSPTLPALGASPADILVTSVGGTPRIYARASQLMLRSQDNIDGLCLLENGDGQFDLNTDGVRFSLAARSPSLGNTMSPADILRPGPVVAVSISTLGLERNDNLDAMKCRARP